MSKLSAVFIPGKMYHTLFFLSQSQMSFPFYTHFNPKKRIGNVNEMGVFGMLAESTIQCSEGSAPSQGVETGIVFSKETA